MTAPVRSPLALARPVVLALLLGGCAAGGPDLPEPRQEREPAAGDIERVFFLVGDAGEATTGTSPLLQVLQRDVERWAARLPADSAVTVFFLGDIRYPYGLRPRTSDNFDEDTTVIMSQVRVVSGPRARAKGVRGRFLAGNHDWGVREAFPGYLRLKRLDEFLDLSAELTGALVGLKPEPGSGGPFILDTTPGLRLLLLDTAWWLMAAEDEDRNEFLADLEDAMASAGDRTVIFLAHHPFASVGMHGGRYSLTEKLGLGYLLRRAGAWVQSLNSPTYRALTRSLRGIFARRGPPFLFIGGHDHSLQVLGRVRETDPAYTLVSGAGSKLTDVGPEPGLRFARSAPGYMRLFVTRDGGLHVTVVGGEPRYLECPAWDEACMEDGIRSFDVLYSERLR